MALLRRRPGPAYALMLLALVPVSAAAQPAAPVVSAGYEAAYDRFHYYFENPSTFDTRELVPHNFQQTYWADNRWLIVSARYRIRGQAMETEAGLTPSRETRGDDVDAFFLASGDVATSGTSGRVDMRSFRFRQDAVLGSLRGWEWYGGYRFRRDRQVFHSRQLRTVTHTQPPSSQSFPIDGAETTTSDVHEVRFGARRQWTRAAWRVRAGVDAAPAAYARLTTILPFKYPGREIVFAAPVLVLNPWLTVVRGERWPIAVSVAATRAFSYLDSRQFHRRAVTVSVSAGRALP